MARLGTRLAVASLVLVVTSCAGDAGAGSPAPEPPDDAAAALRFSCWGDAHPFTPQLLDAPANAELDQHPSARALLAFLEAGGPETDFLPKRGWLLAGRDERSAAFVARVPGDPPFAEAQVALQESGGWRVVGWDQCRPRAVFAGLNGATWTLDPELLPPGPEATQFRALVTETECASGRPSGGRVLPPAIFYGTDEVTVVFAVRPQPGDAFNCQGNPATPVLVVLDEPLGERRLLDGGVFPPHDPTQPWP